MVLEAGRLGMVTIATNMAGRGTDIVLGGGINHQIDAILANDEMSAEEKQAKIDALKAEWKVQHDQVVAAGGLRIIGSERHESRRIDNQLRGRSGRQGDPGSSVFYLSMEDQLLRIFGGDRMRAIADRLKLEEGVAIESKMLTRMIESAQRKVEGRNYDIRKQLLEFDDVQNDQRREIYRLRNEILESSDVSEMIKNLRDGYFTDLFRARVPAETVEEQWDLDGLLGDLKNNWGIDIDMKGTTPGPASAAMCCCRCSTPRGDSTLRRSMHYVRASICAVTLRSSPSKNTSAKRFPCSKRCLTPCAKAFVVCSCMFKSSCLKKLSRLLRQVKKRANRALRMLTLSTTRLRGSTSRMSAVTIPAPVVPASALRIATAN